MIKTEAPSLLKDVLANYSRLDVVTFQVVANRLDFIAREMGITTLRTAYSPIIVEIVDFSCAIADSNGRLVATVNYDPAHLGAIGYAAQWMLMEYGYHDIRPGDVFLQNDPYRGGTHLNDLTVLKPLFFEERLLGIAANRAHHIDTGGKTAGGLAADARDIYTEGIQIPVVRWFSEGVENTELRRLIMQNVRYSEPQEADLRAQLAAVDTAEARVAELVDRYGFDVVGEAMQARLDQSEAGMRAVIAAIPDGEYEQVDYMENDGLSDEPVRVGVTIRVRGDDIELDYGLCDPQAAGPINCGYGVLASASFIALLQLLPRTVPFSAGSFRPVHIVAPRGSVVNPAPPAPVFAGVTEVSMRLWDCIVAALATTGVPGLIAATYGTCFGFAGEAWDRHSEHRRAGFTFFLEGGWGAAPWRDGWNATPNQTSNFKDFPTEVLENHLPLLVERVELRRDSGGAGRFRGGVGVERWFRVLSDVVDVACEADRFETSAFGLFGGLPAMPNAAMVQRTGKQEPRSFKAEFGLVSSSKFCDVRLERGDRFGLLTGGGGGWGDPFERSEDQILSDVRHGIVGVAAALDLYGVAISGTGSELAVDPEATAAHRRKPREATQRGVAINDWVNINAESARLRQVGGHHNNNVRRQFDAAVELACESINREICLASCIRKADGRVCPFHNAEARRNWDPQLFRDWARFTDQSGNTRCLQWHAVRRALEAPQAVTEPVGPMTAAEREL